MEVVASANKLPSLDELDLRSNSISLLEFFNLVLNHDQTTRKRLASSSLLKKEKNDPGCSTTRRRLSRLNLDGNHSNHIWPKGDAKKIKKVLLWLLNHDAPSILFLGHRFARAYLCCSVVQHAMDLNWVGKSRWRGGAISSFDSSSFVPLALWPHMLARPSMILLSIEPKRQASVAFRLVLDGVGMFASLRDAAGWLTDTGERWVKMVYLQEIDWYHETIPKLTQLF